MSESSQLYVQRLVLYCCAQKKAGVYVDKHMQNTNAENVQDTKFTDVTVSGTHSYH
jgi:hypothetical protein